MKRLIPLALFLTLAGCGSKDQLAFLGRWHADFLVDKIREGGTDQDRQREGLKGALQVYATHNSFKLHLEGEQEAVDVDGNWEHKGTEMTLHFTKVKIDDMGGAERRDPNRKFIPPPDLQASYSKDLVFHLSKDKQKLNGLEVSMGHLTGHYLLTRSTD